MGRLAKIRDIVFAILSIAFLSCFLAVGIARFDKLDLPDWTFPADFSYLENTDLPNEPTFTVSSFQKGSYQKAVASYLRERFPGHDAVLFAHAAVERVATAAASDIFGFDLYPTYFGSRFYYSKTYGTVFPLPVKANDLWAYGNSVCYNNLAKAYPNTPIILYRVCQAEYSDANPAALLVSKCITNDMFYQKFVPLLASNITYLDDHVETTEDYLATNNHTDHHWKASTAYRAYRDIMTVLGKEDELIDVTSRTFDDVPFWGMVTRLSLCFTEPDHIESLDFHEPGFRITVDGQVWGARSFKSRYYDGTTMPDIFVSREAEYYGAVEGEVVYENPLKRSGTLLVIRDSQSIPIESLLASHYRTTYFIDPRIADFDIGDFMQHHTVDAILIIGREDGLFYTDDIPDAITVKTSS